MASIFPFSQRASKDVGTLLCTPRHALKQFLPDMIADYSRMPRWVSGVE